MEFLLSILFFCLIGLQHYQLIRAVAVECAHARSLDFVHMALSSMSLSSSSAFGVIYCRSIIILSHHHQLDFHISTRIWLKSGFRRELNEESSSSVVLERIFPMLLCLSNGNAFEFITCNSILIYFDSHIYISNRSLDTSSRTHIIQEIDEWMCKWVGCVACIALPIHKYNNCVLKI